MLRAEQEEGFSFTSKLLGMSEPVSLVVLGERKMFLVRKERVGGGGSLVEVGVMSVGQEDS